MKYAILITVILLSGCETLEQFFPEKTEKAVRQAVEKWCDVPEDLRADVRDAIEQQCPLEVVDE